MFNNKKKTVLVVDDHSHFLEDTEDMLLNHGYDVITADSGQAAIEKYKEKKPDIVFLDLRMTGMDGYETFIKIKNDDKKAKIVFVSAGGVDKDRYNYAKNRGLLGVIKKPAELDDMKFLIGKHA